MCNTVHMHFYVLTCDFQSFLKKYFVQTKNCNNYVLDIILKNNFILCMFHFSYWLNFVLPN